MSPWFGNVLCHCFARRPGVVVGRLSGPQLAQQPRKSKSARESEKPSGMVGGDGGLIETEDLPQTVAAEMDVLGMFAFGRNGKAEHTLGVGTLVRQTVFNQPVEYAIKRHTIERRSPKACSISW